ncbi:dTDP-4-dehydrorhamnose reductase [Rheinheimera sp. D18]|uniref:dTDP-4-dehydrorhamnose reductase n=1 Tax=Rheinheimera sp. D18 TaxID=2545632 RepID=UPI0010486216|nr:dTDP-4-dehydrorhamnose reductase [Rheinheimera sp. D18]QBL09816.1 dTDP-4-dehydrorhamnose reductase [Rheinheimera sp. D18]
MKILILGGSGQLGNCLKRELGLGGIQYVAPPRAELDLSCTADFSGIIKQYAVDAVVNAAAYTAVDKAEQDADMAFKLNATLPEQLAVACQQFGLPLYHVSTDYVFDGLACRPYCESASVAPVSVYGKSKLAGEMAVLKHCEKGAIIRTSWLYSEFGQNFVKTILRLAQSKPELAVVADQVGAPTYAGDLAQAIVQILLTTKHSAPAIDVYHFANQGVASWYDFAWHILQRRQIAVPLKPITTEDYPTPAQRPAYSVLNSTRISQRFAVKNRHWLEALAPVLDKLL